jgi:hypothetical protein
MVSNYAEIADCRFSIEMAHRSGHDRSRRVENHMHAIALHFMHYNFVRISQVATMHVTNESGSHQKAFVY